MSVPPQGAFDAAAYGKAVWVVRVLHWEPETPGLKLALLQLAVRPEDPRSFSGPLRPSLTAGGGGGLNFPGTSFGLHVPLQSTTSSFLEQRFPPLCLYPLTWDCAPDGQGGCGITGPGSLHPLHLFACLKPHLKLKERKWRLEALGQEAEPENQSFQF